jgi:hypothetical protein
MSTYRITGEWNGNFAKLPARITASLRGDTNPTTTISASADRILNTPAVVALTPQAGAHHASQHYSEGIKVQDFGGSCAHLVGGTAASEHYRNVGRID